ncbi:hypothetical protein HK100_011911 [Physocladia obscura]|uniref:Transcription initiation factor IIE subunit alpha N-terminal domain-containing protein n=1 Tax=Physocladia obscura TaxID=109957 RepID=A0AAD5T0I2_9FUNG|nr:hypothetical protein HK100_011911 [Physocladia obscura]
MEGNLSTVQNSAGDPTIDEILRELVMRVARSYYQPHFVIILDLLILKGAMREEDMAIALRVSPGDTRKLCKKLEADRMIKANSVVIELKHQKHTKKSSRTFYYIDFKSFVNVLKYKMFKIQDLIRKEIDERNNNLAYECPSCKAKFDPYAVLRMMRPEDGLFICELCQSVLEQEKGTDFENDLSRRFNMERMPILKLLQQTESHVIPEFAPPTEASMKVPAQGASAQVNYVQPNEIKVELDGHENLEKITPITDEFNDVFAVDNKDSIMKDYYARLQAEVGNESPALKLSSDGGNSPFSGVGSTSTGNKRETASNNEDIKKRAKLEEDDESDLDDEEFVEL